MRCALGVIVFLAAGVLAVGGAEEPDEAGVDPGSIGDYSSFRLSQKSLVPIGAGSCAKGGCHGGALPKPDETPDGKEWTIWYEKAEARHRKAYDLLVSDRSKNMAALLSAFDRLESEPTERKDCLSCHAMDVPDGLERNTQFKITEGVSCEACHGRATHWIESHSNNGWKSKTAEQKASLGMYDTRDLIRRAELCMSCHVGDEDRNVTHRMMAAGHPELPFELATDLRGVPRHWRNGPSFLDPKKNEGPAFHARVWAVGQAMLLRESAKRAMRWAESSEGVELALFECYACHHELGFSKKAAVPHQERKLRRTLAYPELGSPAWSSTSWAVSRQLARLIFDEEKARLMEKAIGDLRSQFTIAVSNKERIRVAAKRVAALADDLAKTAAKKQFSKNDVYDLMQWIASDNALIAETGFRGAEQALRAMLALYPQAVEERLTNHDEVFVTLAKIEKMLLDSNDPDRDWLAAALGKYDHDDFTERMKQLEAQIIEGRPMLGETISRGND